MNEPKLASGKSPLGPIKSWVRGKPRLVATETASTPLPKTTSEQAPEFTYSIGVIFRAGILVLGVTLIVGLASWLILALTVLATPVIDGKMYNVQRSAWIQGKAPAGSVAAAMPQEVSRDMLGRIADLATGFPGATINVIVAHPGDTVYSKLDGTLVVNEKETKYVIPEGVTETDLTKYLTVCVEGPCPDGKKVIEVPIQNVLGEVIGGFGFSGPVNIPALEGR